VLLDQQAQQDHKGIEVILPALQVLFNMQVALNLAVMLLISFMMKKHLV
jgi:hypothetical protein